MSALAVRPAAVAGRFYPGRPDELRATVDRLIDAADAPELADEPLAPAYVVPHAGYRFSGPTAAPVYARLRAHAGSVRRVVLIGPAHYMRLRGCAVPTVDRWVTPLGDVPVDTEGCRALAADGPPLAAADDEPHRPEHSLEVQLPFLQRALPAGVPVLPVVAGAASADEVADLLSLVAPGLAGTVLLCSTDLSHYHDDATARELDRRTVDAVLAGDPERIGVRDACGVFGLRGTMAYAGRTGWTARLLALATSADTAGATDRVVGYSAFSFDPVRNDPAGGARL
jgi:AmmeMemoRadiSam system protein B